MATAEKHITSHKDAGGKSPNYRAPARTTPRRKSFTFGGTIEPFHVDGDDLRAKTHGQWKKNSNPIRRLTTSYVLDAFREANIRRAQTIAHYLQNQGHTVVVSLVAPYRDIREELKSIHAGRTRRVYVRAHERSRRGAGEDKACEDYEPPLANFIEIDTTGRAVEDSLKELLDQL